MHGARECESVAYKKSLSASQFVVKFMWEWWTTGTGPETPVRSKPVLL